MPSAIITPMKRSYLLPGIAGLLILGLITLAGVHHADLVVLNPQGPVGREERWVIIITVALAAIIVVPLFGLLAWFSYRYRASRSGPKGRHQPDWDHDSALVEFSWWLVPTAIVIILSFIAWKTTFDLDPFKPLQSSHGPLRVQVVALEWKWLFIYPDLGIASVNQLEFPAGTPVHFDVTSDAPMNQFWIPSLGGEIMAMPGMTNQLSLLADHDGTYAGLSSNISGSGFAGMTFDAKAVSPQDFNAWVQSVRASNNPLNATSYAALSAPSSYVPVQYFSSVADGIYTDSMMKYMGTMSLPSSEHMSEPSSATDSMPSMDMPMQTASPGMVSSTSAPLTDHPVYPI